MKTEDNITMPRNEFKGLIAGLIGCSITDKGQRIEEIVADNLIFRLAQTPATPFEDTDSILKRKCEHIRQQIAVAGTILKHWDK